MSDLISRQAVKEWLDRWEGYIDKDIIARMQYRVIDIPSEQPDVSDTNVGDMISRRAAIDALGDEPEVWSGKDEYEQGLNNQWHYDVNALKSLPSAQPFHNITMNDVLKYIDGMPEDVWQEFTACLECRGWELQRRTAKWCGGDFA